MGSIVQKSVLNFIDMMNKPREKVLQKIWGKTSNKFEIIKFSRQFNGRQIYLKIM
jgi:hypothetical protein